MMASINPIDIAAKPEMLKNVAIVRWVSWVDTGPVTKKMPVAAIESAASHSNP